MLRLSDIMAPDAASMTGDLCEWPLGDMLLWLHQSQRTVELHVTFEQGHGVIYMRQGRIYRASLGSLAGHDAIGSMMAIEAGQFALAPSYIPYPSANLDGDTKVMILRWAIGRDEARAS